MSCWSGGGSGGLGTQATQLAAAAGAKPIAVVSDDSRGEYAMKCGAVGYINRRDFDHWGMPPHNNDSEPSALDGRRPRLRQTAVGNRRRAAGSGHRRGASGRGYGSQ